MCSVNVRNNRMIKVQRTLFTSFLICIQKTIHKISFIKCSASSFFIRIFGVTVSTFLQVKIKTLNTNNFFLNNDLTMKFPTRVP